MREELTIEIVNALRPYLSQEEIQEMKFKLVMILNKYEIQERCTEIAILDEDKNTAILKKFIAAKIASGRTVRTIGFYKTSLEVIRLTLLAVSKCVYKHHNDIYTRNHHKKHCNHPFSK